MGETQSMVTEVRDLVLTIRSGKDRTVVKHPPLPPTVPCEDQPGRSGLPPPGDSSPEPSRSATPDVHKPVGMMEEFDE